MKKFFFWTAIAIFAFVMVLVVIGLILSPNFSVNRSITIDAPPEVIFPYINDLEDWPEWQPWADDPAVDITLGEITQGVGATQSWEDSHGGGSLKIEEVTPNQSVRYFVSFKDGNSTAAATLILGPPVSDPESFPQKTQVSWGFNGKDNTPVLGGYAAQFMELTVGPMFEDGLERLKILAEAQQNQEIEEADAISVGLN